MQGSLEAPPIVVKGIFWKTVLLIMGACGFVGVGIWLLKVPSGLLIGTISIVFFGFCAIAGIIRLFKPAFVEISPSGINCFYGWKSHAFKWSDFAGFRLTNVGRTTFVGFDVSPSCTQMLAMRGANRAIAGIDGTLPTHLEIGPDELLVLISRAAKKWGEPHSSASTEHEVRNL